jgi:hypothetical protein
MFGSSTTRISNAVVVPPPQAAAVDSSATGGTSPTPPGGSPAVPDPGIAPSATPSQDLLTPSQSRRVVVRSSTPLFVTGARWSNLDPGIAYADGNGVVQAIAPGTARIVALVALPDGAVRATVFHLTVVP